MNKPTLEEYIEALKKISKNPNDRVRIVSEGGLLAIGGIAAAGGASAAAIATSTVTIGGSSVLGSAVSAVGFGALAATPIGWTIGLGALGVLGTAGLIHLYKSGVKSEELIKDTVNDLKKKINDFENQAIDIDCYDEKLGKVAGLYALLFQMQLISDQETIELIFEGISNGSIDIDESFRIARQLVENAVISIDSDAKLTDTL